MPSPPDPVPHSPAGGVADGGSLAGAFADLRASTLALFDAVDDRSFRTQLHPDFSPIGWHLGHIAYTEASWILRTAAGRPLPRPELERTFHVEGLPKAERHGIPGFATVARYAAEVREEVSGWLDRGPAAEHARLVNFVLQHECQHNETISLLQHLLRADAAPEAGAEDAAGAPDIEFLPIPGGTARIGSAAAAALDNEGPVHEREVAPFALARFPVTQAQFAAFMADGGYRAASLWSDEGWRWRSANGIERPLYWTGAAPDHPVSGVSWHEAEAFCRWAGARLPTEIEWEWAATGPRAAASDATTPWGGALPDWRRCVIEARRAADERPNGPGGTAPVGSHPEGASPFGVEDMLGNVWEWTSSTFAPYPGFDPWPYPGYSQAYFDGCHRVLRGGSWATRRWALRTSFRNWYLPGIRQILAGFRCARDR